MFIVCSFFKTATETSSLKTTTEETPATEIESTTSIGIFFNVILLIRIVYSLFSRQLRKHRH